MALVAMSLALPLTGCFESSAQNPRATDDPIPNVTFLTPTPRKDPGENEATNEGVLQMGVGDDHACVIKNDRSLWCWGQDTSGLTLSEFSPLRVGRLNDWAYFDGGDGHSCGLSVSGGLLCWGLNTSGQVGNGDLAEYRGPTQVPQADLNTDWIAVTAGGQHSCGIREDSANNATLWCWGRNADGQLGLGDTAATYWSPTQVGVDNRWSTIAAGSSHSCGINNAKLYCWGANANSQLGHASVDTTLPSMVNGADWAQVSAGGSHSCAIDSAGLLYCWGANDAGQLGIGGAAVTGLPQQVGVATNWLAVSAGGQHSCAVNSDYELYCWGRNHVGQTGAGSTFNQPQPTQVGASIEWLDVRSGEGYSCGRDRFEKVYCWGLNHDGQVGDGSAKDYRLPATFNGDEDWRLVRTGLTHSCAIKLDKTLWCGGMNEYGQLGNKSLEASGIPLKVTEDVNWIDVSVGAYHSCAINSLNKLFCWGANESQQTGNANINNVAENWTPQEELTGSGLWRWVFAGKAHTCALDTSQALFCWGSDADGRLGDGGGVGGITDVPQAVAGGNWSGVTLGDSHTCAVNSSRQLFCWGNNASGQLGDGSLVSSAAPVQVVVAGVEWLAVAAGAEHTCALTTTGTVYCWGRNDRGQLGDPTSILTVSPSPLLAKLEGWTSIYARGKSSCGLRNAQPFCWGDNSEVQLTSRLLSGDSAAEPRAISFFGLWSDFSLSESHACGIRSLESTVNPMYCWGRHASSQLGGDTAWRLTPTLLPVD